jgi:hypothetical protein
MWFVFANSASTSAIDFAYRVNDDRVFVIKFKGMLPTFLKVDYCDSHVHMETDADIAECLTMTFDSMNKFYSDDLLFIPSGKRFGMYKADSNRILYVREFWNVPSIQLPPCKSPEMILVRPRDSRTYNLIPSC